MKKSNSKLVWIQIIKKAVSPDPDSSDYSEDFDSCTSSSGEQIGTNLSTPPSDIRLHYSPVRHYPPQTPPPGYRPPCPGELHLKLGSLSALSPDDILPKNKRRRKARKLAQSTKNRNKDDGKDTKVKKGKLNVVNISEGAIERPMESKEPVCITLPTVQTKKSKGTLALFKKVKKKVNLK